MEVAKATRWTLTGACRGGRMASEEFLGVIGANAPAKQVLLWPSALFEVWGTSETCSWCNEPQGPRRLLWRLDLPGIPKQLCFRRVCRLQAEGLGIKAYKSRFQGLSFMVSYLLLSTDCTSQHFQVPGCARRIWHRSQGQQCLSVR